MNLNKKNIAKTFSLEASITYLNGSGDTTYNKELNCKIDNDIKQNDDYIYYNCEISIPNINNIIKIYLRKGNKDIEGKDVTYNLNSLSNLNLMKCTKELYIFNLTREIEEKPGQFILKGKMHKNFTDTNEFRIGYSDYGYIMEYYYINGILKCQKKSELFECILLPTYIIENESIDYTIAESLKSKIIIVARFLNKTNIEFPKISKKRNPNEKNATIISVGNFNHSNKSEDAEGRIYLKCTNYALKNLEEFIRFYVNITYSYNDTKSKVIKKTEQFEVYGYKDLSEIYKSIISYHLFYMNTTNKTIEIISSPCNISFSDDYDFIEVNNEMNINFDEDEIYDFLEEKEKKFDLMYLKPNKKGSYNATNNSNSFSFEFELLDDIINIKDNSEVNVSYIPVNRKRFYDNCIITKNKSQSYNIECSPKRSVFAPMKTLNINITNLLKKRRLRTVRNRILQETDDTILIAHEDTSGYINYDFKPRVFPKKDSNGLSGGAIAAIIIASIVAIAAVIFVIIKCNGPARPLVKNNDLVNIPNSSTMISRY